MQMLIRRIRDALAAGEPIEDLLAELEARTGEVSGGADEPAGQVAGLTDQVNAALAERDAARALADAAVDRYRVARAETLGVTPDFLPGATIEAVDAAAERARALVAGIETRVRDQLAAGYVPAGDSGRTPPDLAALTPIDKIKAGLNQPVRQ